MRFVVISIIFVAILVDVLIVLGIVVGFLSIPFF